MTGPREGVVAQGGGAPRPAPGGDPMLLRRLFEEPYAFDFFQAVRLLQRLNPGVAHPVGHNHPPEEEAVRFRARLSLLFPPSAIHDLRRLRRPLDYGPGDGAAAAEGADPPPPVMTVTFLGLTGLVGVLPRHYTELLLRLEEKSDHEVGERHALRAWFDLFNHRLISLFYRAWEKYRFYLAYERGKHLAPEPDSFVGALLSLVGLGTPALRQRLRVARRPPPGQRRAETFAQVDDLSLLFYSGFLAHRPRCAVSLQALLEDYFQLPVVVQQFQGQWLRLGADNQSRLGEGGNNQLGRGLVAGERVWDAQSKFRVRVGPLRFDQFTALLPSRAPGAAQKAFFLLCHLVRLYVGPGLDFDVRLVLAAAEVPAMRLAEDGGRSPRLGWNTWSLSGARSHDAEEAVFDGQEVVWVSDAPR